MRLKSAVVYLTIFLACSAGAFASQSVDLDAVLKNLNSQIRTEKLAVKELTATEFKKWLSEVLNLTASPRERRTVLNELVVGKIPAGWSLHVSKSDGTAADRVVLSRMSSPRAELTVVYGNRILSFAETLKGNCGTGLCAEPFKGEFPRGSGGDFPKSIPVAITEVQASGELARDALWIQIRLSRKNLHDIAQYFAVGRSSQELHAFLEKRLGAHFQIWIDLQDLFAGWIAPKVNTFPSKADHGGPFALAREFYFEKQTPLSQEKAASADTFAAFLGKHYCLLPDLIEPRFGDIVYAPGVHAARFIMKDPVSGRGIGLSVHAGGPYRFWWIDEDFSKRPFAKSPERDLRLTRLDFWRRCK